ILAALYVGWLYLDRDTPSCGGRRSHWVRNWRVWTYFRDYFPITVSYMSLCSVETRAGKINQCVAIREMIRFPHNTFTTSHYTTRINRLVSSEKASASYLLSRPGGGQAAVIAVGGAPESLDARPGALTLQLLQRKGFIKLALKHGAWLVPVFSFGENELFDQMENPTGSALRRVQDRLQRIMGVALPLFHARGVFQYSFGLLPYRKPIHTVVPVTEDFLGRPIPVSQNPCPSKEDIDALHALYMEALTQVFEENKNNYGIPEDKHLNFI
uniref:Monoacylglycerol O-acyltransferase 3a n=1 Tax=Cyprinus carpio TaxID=7962 RepID=A0A8C2EC75_CYPCA